MSALSPGASDRQRQLVWHIPCAWPGISRPVSLADEAVKSTGKVNTIEACNNVTAREMCVIHVHR